MLTKSGIIVGLGETNDEVVETMGDLRAHGVDVVTIGQYLQPSAKHAQIDRWVHPDEFRWFREQGEALGFGSVFSGPLVRSSYRADEQRHAAAQVVARWRTRALLGVVALLASAAVIATVVSQTSGSPSREPSAARLSRRASSRRADLEVGASTRWP